jgi:hypothetical protein
MAGDSDEQFGHGILATKSILDTHRNQLGGASPLLALLLQ